MRLHVGTVALVLVLWSCCSVLAHASRPQKAAQVQKHSGGQTQKLASTNVNRKQQHHADLHAMVAAQDARARAPVPRRQTSTVAKKVPAAAQARNTQSFRETTKQQQKAVLKKSGAHVAAKLSAKEQIALHSDLLCGDGSAGDCAPQQSCFFPNTVFDQDDATCKQLGVTYGCCYHRVHTQGDQGQAYYPANIAPALQPSVSMTASMAQVYAAPCGNDANVHSGQCLNSDDCHDYHDGTSIDTDGSGGAGCVAGRICCNTKTPQSEPWSQIANPLFDHDTDKLDELGNGVVMTDTLPGKSLDVSRPLSSAAASTPTASLTAVLSLIFAALLAAF